MLATVVVLPSTARLPVTVRLMALRLACRPILVMFGCAAVVSVPDRLVANRFRACTLPCTPTPPRTCNSPDVVLVLIRLPVNVKGVPSTVLVTLLAAARLFSTAGCLIKRIIVG